jgi:hypothetical protein
VRELELFIANATVFALADAVGAAQRGRAAGDARAIPIPAKLVRELLGGGWQSAAQPAERREGGFVLTPRAALRDVARDLERQLFARLFREHDGDFDAMARVLLEGDDPAAARKVRLRFNQLGLRAKDLRRG